jgi:TolB-like protein
LIRTIARKGFRFVGDIQEKQTSEDGASAKSPLRTAQMATPPLLLPDKPSIAVLPFQNLSSDLEQEYFAEGVVEDIISALSRKRWLFVIARNSSFTYKGRTVDVKQVGRELGVRYVLEGSVRKSANRVRITGHLIDAATGVHLSAERAGIRRPPSSLHPPFVHFVLATVARSESGLRTRSCTAMRWNTPPTPGALAQVRVVVSRSVIT